MFALPGEELVNNAGKYLVFFESYLMSACVCVCETYCVRFWSQTVVLLLCVSLFECQNITNILWGKKADMDT